MKKIETKYQLDNTRRYILIVSEKMPNCISIVDSGEACSGILKRWGTKEELKSELQGIINALDEYDVKDVQKKEIVKKNELTEKEKEMEQFFLSKTEGCVIKTLPKKLNYFYLIDKNDKYLMEYNKNNGIVWMKYCDFWSVFKDKYGLSCSETQAFIKTMMEEHLKLSGVTTVYGVFRLWHTMEEHLKLSGVTTVNVW